VNPVHESFETEAQLRLCLEEICCELCRMQHVLDDRLGRRARDQHAPVDAEGQREEPPLAHEVLHRLVPERAADQGAEPLALVVARRAIGLRVERQPLAPQHVGEQQLREQARRVQALLPERARHPVEQPARRPRRLGRRGRGRGGGVLCGVLGRHRCSV